MYALIDCLVTLKPTVIKQVTFSYVITDITSDVLTQSGVERSQVRGWQGEVPRLVNKMRAKIDLMQFMVLLGIASGIAMCSPK